MISYLEKINASNLRAEERIEALKSLTAMGDACKFPPSSGENNNHIHTIYSFSPYTPTMAALKAKKCGLDVAGSVDHDSISAATEIKAACEIVKIGCVTGFELRVNFKNTPFENKKINNPDSIGIAYMTVQGIPSAAVSKVREFLNPLQEARHERNRNMMEKLNPLLTDSFGEEIIKPLSYDNDVLPLTKANEGGSVTERHILCALAMKLFEKYPAKENLLYVLKEKLRIHIPEKIETILRSEQNPHFLYDLIGLLKSSFLESFFIQPNEWECIPVEKVTTFAHSISAIPCYTYLGDVKDSPTGDKKAEKFEDDFLEDLLLVIKELGFIGVTYMPPRNTKNQIFRLQRYCKKYEFMEISGVDINSSRQSFNCPELKQPEFAHLINATWALVAHEKLSSVNVDYGLFAINNPLIAMPLEKRLKAYADIGKNLLPVGTLAIDRAIVNLAQNITM